MILLVGQLKAFYEDMSTWERQFIYSIDKQLLQQKELSFKQKLCVEKIAKKFKARLDPVEAPVPKPVKKIAKEKPVKKSCNATSARSQIRPPAGTVFCSGDVPPWEL